MASSYTTNYELPLWEPQDSFLRTEFNEAHQKIDAALGTMATAAAVESQLSQMSEELEDGLEELSAEVAEAKDLAQGRAQLAAGSYTGTGTYGADHPNTLTFPFPPKLVVLAMGDAHSVLLSPHTQAAGYYEAYICYGMLKPSWNGNSVSWYVDGYFEGSLHSSGGGARQQLNEEGIAYHYLAIG